MRRGAELELPHILVLIDDPQRTVIEPIGAGREALHRLYDTELMRGGGQVAGYAVDGADSERAVQALHALASPQAFATRYGVPTDTPPMLFAVGDGNHSLATAKSIWDSVKGSVGLNHPSRFALVEVVNIHDPALDFAPIHRLLFGVRADVRQALAEAFGDRLSCTDVPSAAAMRARVQAAPGSRHARRADRARRALQRDRDRRPAVHPGRWHAAAVHRWLCRAGRRHARRLRARRRRARTAGGATTAVSAFTSPGWARPTCMRRVVHEGPLPRKTFSMGEAHEKRFYIEARRIVTANVAAATR